MPSHEEILAARDRMLTAHPALRFDSVHLASLEWDVDRVAAFLDRFPGANVDMAARLVHLEHQASKDPQKVRRFLIRYQDRVLYGSDDAYGPGDDKVQAVAEIHAGWVEDWRFLVTHKRMHSPTSRPPSTGCTCRARWSTRFTAATRSRCSRRLEVLRSFHARCNHSCTVAK